MKHLSVRAGPGALAHIQREGFKPADIRAMVGASGGSKWLVLAGLDEAIIRNVLPQLKGPVHLLGSSIGAWRFSCYAQTDPLAALGRFKSAYLDQTYSENPDRDEITRVSAQILLDILGPNGAEEIVNHPVFRTHVMAVRSRNLTKSDRSVPLLAGLVAAMLANHVSRRSLGAFFERALVHDTRDEPPFFNVDDFPIQHIPLSAQNIAPAVLASGSVPFVLNGVRDLPGAVPGMYRDGGIIDYHFDVPLSHGEGITLYPHFYDYMLPGWFDKRRRSRRPQAKHLDRVLLVSPSAEFVASLPRGRIPDRTDFKTMATSERLKVWRQVVAESARLGDEFLELCQGDNLASVAQPIL